MRFRSHKMRTMKFQTGEQLDWNGYGLADLGQSSCISRCSFANGIEVPREAARYAPTYISFSSRSLSHCLIMLW